MDKFKKGDYILVKTNQANVHVSWMVNSGLTSEEIEPSEYVAKIRSVIGDGEAYLIFIPSIGFRCVVNSSEVLRRMHEDELTDDERGSEDSDEFTAPNVFVSHENYQGLSNEDRFKHLAMAAMKKLFPEDKIVSIEQCRSNYIKTDLLATIDFLIQRRCGNNSAILKKRDYFKEMLEHLRFKEYYNVRVGIEDKQEEGATNYIYLAVDTEFKEVAISSYDIRFIHSLGPEYDSIYRFFTDFRREISSSLMTKNTNNQRKEKHMDKEFIENLRRMHEDAYRKIDSSAVVKAVMGDADSELKSIVETYKESGYVLVDINNFGMGSTHLGEFLVFFRQNE